MLKKEFSDALRKLIECLILLLAVPLAVLWDKFVIHFGWSYRDVFNFVFQVTIVIYPIYSGMTIFQSEIKNKAFEYLFSLPVSRWKIVLHKIFWRAAFFLLLLGVSSFFSVFKNVWINGFNLIILFLISIFLSFTLSSVVIGPIGVGLVYLIIYLNSQIINYLLWRAEKVTFNLTSFLSSFISAALLLIPLGMTFWLTFKNMDVKSLKLQLKYYKLIALPSIGTLILFAILFYGRYLKWAQRA
jgi:hypothetical protein